MEPHFKMSKKAADVQQKADKKKTNENLKEVQSDSSLATTIQTNEATRGSTLFHSSLIIMSKSQKGFLFL